MNFLEKLDYLMEKKNLNKSTLSKACNIPYTTIDGWYKKGYEGLKLTTLRKLADFFGTSLDYWASENDEQSLQYASTSDKTLSDIHTKLISQIKTMSNTEAKAVLAFVNTLDRINKKEVD